jgi:membrane fusion protein (multidrug efflux system)
MAIMALAAAVAAGTTAYAGRGKESTDDAQVEAHVSNVSPRVAGLVKSVLVKDNQVVAPGDVLVELDDSDLLAKRAAAQADVAAAEANVRAAETQRALVEKTADSNLAVAKGGIVQAQGGAATNAAGIDQARAELAAATSRQALVHTELERVERLFAERALAKAQLDAARTNADQADAALAAARARVTSAEAGRATSFGAIESAKGRLIAAESGPEQIAAARAQVDLARAKADQAKAALHQLELALSYTKVRAEVGGVVSRRSVEVGQLASPERPMLALVPLEDTWVVANFKEDQLAHMRVGQPVTVKVDAYDVALRGHVESFSAGTGSRFALLPPDNASGNFTKVVQRVPVVVVLDAHDLVLRPGMSAAVSVETR